MMIYLLVQKYGEEAKDAFSTLWAAEAAKQRCLRAWLEADVSGSFDPRRECPDDITDSLEDYLWRCGCQVWIEQYEVDAPTYVSAED